MSAATIQIGHDLSVEAVVIGPESTQRVGMQLTRISAQQLAHALLEYAGVEAKTAGRGRETVVGGWSTVPEVAKSRTKVVSVARQRTVRL